MEIVINDTTANDQLFLRVLRTIIGPEPIHSRIDLCCNIARLTRYLPGQDKVYVDIVEHDLGSEQPYFVKADVREDHAVFNRHYDLATCTDGIEHLHANEGLDLIEKALKISDKCIFFTPLGYTRMEPGDPHPDMHRSLWSPKQFRDWGCITYPNYHSALGIGAFFFWHCKDIKKDFQRVKFIHDKEPLR